MSENKSLPFVVDRQLPEFVREEYPAFVAFLQAYYEYVADQSVDVSELKDIDQTLDVFIQRFKKDLAVNLPIVVQDERQLLQNIKDSYLAKGSEGSYKLLFQLLFGKGVELYYPGQSMLVPSDGRWNQEISIFVDVDYGNPEEVVGKLVEISSGNRVLSVLIDRKEELIGEVDRVKLVGENVYEMYLDKRFFGEIKSGDKIRYLDEFQATILPATTNIKVTQEGKNFRVGQVFELKQGTGTGALVKITQVTPNGGIQRAELIKFGIGYTADFALSILSTTSVTTKAKSIKASSARLSRDTYLIDSTAGNIDYTTGSTTVTGNNGTQFGDPAEIQEGDELYNSLDTFIGVVKTINASDDIELVEPATITGNGEVYKYAAPRQDGDGVKKTYIDTLGVQQDGKWNTTTLGDSTQGFQEQGYINAADVFSYEYLDATYAGEIKREFALAAENAQVDADEPAIMEINLGALNRYPGYFETNAGFVSDSIFIQDSFYYQKFSYVLRIDERLQSYAAAVKTMIHPAGMKLFGEYNIDNKFDLAVALQSMVKSLGITLDDDINEFTDSLVYHMTKILNDNVTYIDDGILLKKNNKDLADTVPPLTDSSVWRFTKALNDVLSTSDVGRVYEIQKSLATTYNTASMYENTTKYVTKALEDSQGVVDTDLGVSGLYFDLFTKYIEDNTGTFDEGGCIHKNSFQGQDYWICTEEYGVGYEQPISN